MADFKPCGTAIGFGHADCVQVKSQLTLNFHLEPPAGMRLRLLRSGGARSKLLRVTIASPTTPLTRLPVRSRVVSINLDINKVISKLMEPPAGIEPATYAFRKRRSTN